MWTDARTDAGRRIGNDVVRFRHAARGNGATGAVLDSPIRIGFSCAASPDVTSVGNRWLAAWQRHWSHGDSHDDITAAFYSFS